MQRIETLRPEDGWVLVVGPSGVSSTPLRCDVCHLDPVYRPKNPLVNWSGDAFTDTGAPATGWMPLPWDTRLIKLYEMLCQHDWLWEYSDDPSASARGRRERDVIDDLVRKIGPGAVNMHNQFEGGRSRPSLMDLL